jgi:5-methylcytosine-specific restriction endonuclease McrA
MPVLEQRVFEQYEYQGYLITIQDYYCMYIPSLEGIAIPLKYSHLFDNMDDVLNNEFIFEQNGIINYETTYCKAMEEYQETEILPLFHFDPDDTSVYLQGININSSSAVLSYIVNEINEVLDLKAKTVVLKQICKKTITPKSSKTQRGFNQVAWSSMVKLRDKQCTECSSVYDLHAHHVKSFKDNEELRYDINNGVTLCGQCHRKWHKENGR